MNIFQKILFPFSGPKTKFLESKWWHRLVKTLFMLSFILCCLIGGFLVGSEVKNQIQQYKNIVDSQSSGKTLGELGDVSNKEAKFISAIKKKGYKPEEAIEFVKQKRAEGAPGTLKTQIPEEIRSDKKNILQQILYMIILYISISYGTYIGLQLAYFKGIIYIIYGNKGS